jgi:chromosome segregation ATPase
MQDGFLSIINFLPQFERGKPVGERIDDLQNYIFQLRERLEYMLQNLTPADNFNTAQMGNWSDNLLSPVYERIANAEREIGAAKTRIGKVEDSVAGLGEALEQLAGDVGDLATRADALETSVGTLEDKVNELNTGFVARVDEILKEHGLI